MPRIKRIKKRKAIVDKRNLFDTLPQDPINEIASYLAYKQLTKLRVSRQMHALIEETPAGKKARAANELEDDIKSIAQGNHYRELIIHCLFSSSFYSCSSILVYQALIKAKLISPELNISSYLLYNAIDASMGAIFAAGFGKMLPNYHLKEECSMIPTMNIGALTTYSVNTGILIGIKTAEMVSHITHLPKQLQYVGINFGYLIGFGLGELAAAKLGMYALSGQNKFTLFEDTNNRNYLSQKVKNIRRELSARKM